MATAKSTSPPVAQSEVPAVIAGSVNLMAFAGALAQAGIGRPFGIKRIEWWSGGGSNSRPSHCECQITTPNHEVFWVICISTYSPIELPRVS